MRNLFGFVCLIFIPLSLNSIRINVWCQHFGMKRLKFKLFQLVKTRVRTLIWQARQLSNCCPSSFVEWPQRMWWEWLLGERGRERKRERYYGVTKTTREGMREAQKEWETRDKKEREREVREPADVKVPPITSCFSSTPSLCLSLSVPLFLPFPLTFLSWRFAPFWRPLSISDNSGDASVVAHTSAHASSRRQRKLKSELRCTHTRSETQTDTVTHSGGLWVHAPRGA